MELGEIIARLESLEGPSREMDGWVHLWLDGLSPHGRRLDPDRGMTGWSGEVWDGVRWDRVPAPGYTSDPAAAESLLDQVLPGWYFAVSKEPPVHGKAYHGTVSNLYTFGLDEDGDPFRKSQDYAPTMALAILIPVLKAKMPLTSTGDGPK